MEKVFVPDDFYCPITGELMKNPVSDKEGNTYENRAILRWLSTNNTSPLTRSPLSQTDLVVNHSMRKSIESIKNKLSEDQLKIRSKVIKEEMKSYNDTLQQIQLQTFVDKDNLMVRIQTPDVIHRAPIDLVLCIDISGSMGSEAVLKGDDGNNVHNGISILSLTVSAAKTILHSLNENDNLSIVTFTDTAKCIVNNMCCSKESKKLIEQQLDLLRPMNTTNLWSGIHTSLNIIKKHSPPERVSGIFVLTDGVPNIEPPRGHEYMLDTYLKQNDMKCMINCYGFGYSLDSELLDNISVISGGDGYSFIPDASLLGNVFIHGITNFLISIQNVKLQVELKNGHKFKDGSVVTIQDIHTLKYGKEKNIPFKVDGGDTITSKDVCVTLLLNDFDIVSSKVNKTLIHIDEQVSRLRMVKCLDEWIHMKKFNIEGLQEKVLHMIEWLKEKSSSPYIVNILYDMEGQIREALNMTSMGMKEDWFSKWGIHYIRSLRRAYNNEICNNFKDKGVSNFQGELFNKVRDEISDIFDTLPPPKQTKVVYRGGVTQTSRPIQMRSYNNPTGGCCAKGSLIKMADGTYKPVETLQKGDKVITIKHKVHGTPYPRYKIRGVNYLYYTTSQIECVIETACNNGKQNMVQLNNLRITPYHPIMDEKHAWVFPIFMGEVKQIQCPSMFTFVVKDRGSVIIDDYIFATYGHHLEGEIIFHNYFGSEKVIQDLKLFESYHRGHIHLRENYFQRGKDNKVKKIIHIPDKFFQAFL